MPVNWVSGSSQKKKKKKKKKLERERGPIGINRGKWEENIKSCFLTDMRMRA